MNPVGADRGVGEQVAVAGQHGWTQGQVRPTAALACAAALAVAAESGVTIKVTDEGQTSP